MAYSVHLTRSAEKQLDGLPSTVQSELLDAMRALADTPRPPGCKALQGLDAWRIRVGDYRILYDIDDDPGEVTVFRIAHRREVYRRR